MDLSKDIWESAEFEFYSRYNALVHPVGGDYKGLEHFLDISHEVIGLPSTEFWSKTCDTSKHATMIFLLSSFQDFKSMKTILVLLVSRDIQRTFLSNLKLVDRMRLIIILECCSCMLLRMMQS